MKLLNLTNIFLRETAMANNVRNVIRFLGNDKVQECLKEIVLRLKIDKDSNDLYGTGSIGRVLYGLSGDDAFLSYDEIGSKWIYFEYEDDDILSVITGWQPARLFQEYLLEKMLTLDPNVIIALEYDDESPRFIGVRYVLMDDMEIQSYEREFDASEINFVADEDVEKTRVELEKNCNDTEVLGWEDFWHKQYQLLCDAYDELKSEYPHAYEDPSLRWRQQTN